MHTASHAQRSKKPQCQACISRGKPCSGHPMGTLMDRWAGDLMLCNMWVVWVGPSAVWCCALMLSVCSPYHPNCSCYCSWGELEWNPWTWRKNCSVSVAIKVHFYCPCPSACSWKANQSHVQVRMGLIKKPTVWRGLLALVVKNLLRLCSVMFKLCHLLRCRHLMRLCAVVSPCVVEKTPGLYLLDTLRLCGSRMIELEARRIT